MSIVGDLLEKYDAMLVELGNSAYRLRYASERGFKPQFATSDVRLALAAGLGRTLGEMPSELWDVYDWMDSRVQDSSVTPHAVRVDDLMLSRLIPAESSLKAVTMRTPSGAPFADTGLDDVRLNGQGAALMWLNGPITVVSTRPSDAGSVWLRDWNHGKLFDSLVDMVSFHIDLIERGMMRSERGMNGEMLIIGLDYDASVPLVSESVRARRFRSMSCSDDDPDGAWHLDGEATVYPPPVY